MPLSHVAKRPTTHAWTWPYSGHELSEAADDAPPQDLEGGLQHQPIHGGMMRRRSVDVTEPTRCCTLGKTDNVTGVALVALVALTSLTLTAWALWSRYIALSEEVGAVQHVNELEEYSQDIAGLKLCLEFGFLLEVSTSLLDRTQEFLDAEAKAEVDLEAALRNKVSRGLVRVEASLIEQATRSADNGTAATAAVRQVFRGGNGVHDLVRDAVRVFQGHVAAVKRDTLQKAERGLWEQDAVWDSVQQRLLQLVARLRAGAEGRPELEKVALATGSEGHGRPGLGRYIANFFVNLGAFDKAYREQRRVLAPETRWELEKLHSGLIKPKANEPVVSPAKVGRLEKQLRELIAVNGLPPYVSNRFNHQLEVGLAIVCLSIPESL